MHSVHANHSGYMGSHFDTVTPCMQVRTYMAESLNYPGGRGVYESKVEAGEKKRRGNEKGEKKEKKEEDARGKKVDWPAVEARTRETRCIKVQKPCFHLLHRRYKHKGAK